MVRSRVPVKYGTTEEDETKYFDIFMKKAREKGWLNPESYTNSGVSKGTVLQIGHGPGYTGLEWLKHTEGTKLIALDVSSEMIKIAKRNIKEYPGLEKRVEYLNCRVDKIDLKNNSVDGVFCNGETHEWPDPVKAFNEINRVLKPGGKYHISVHNRGVSSFHLLLEKMFFHGLPKEVWKYYLRSVYAAYTYDELKVILDKTDLKNYQLNMTKAGMHIIGEK
jgi:ubiquinone/menaquinone biosynthesis C-methylase UbiE